MGPNNLRYPFDTEDAIFSMSDRNPACLKTGEKIKASQVLEQPICACCRKHKDEHKKKISQCEFCALFTCIECISKQPVPFPKLDSSIGARNYGVACLICQTKLHINTVTSDILRTLSRTELKVEARERRIEKLSAEMSQSENQLGQ